MLSRLHNNHQLVFDLQMRDTDELGDFPSQMLEAPYFPGLLFIYLSTIID